MIENIEMEDIITWVLGFIALIGLAYFSYRRRPECYPPGPRSLRYFGNFLSITWSRFRHGRHGMEKFVAKLHKKYGKIISFDILTFRVIMLNDHKLIREAWMNSKLNGRLKLHGAAARTGGVIRGILLQDGDEWAEQRRFTLRHLRDFGFGKKSMENIILDEVLELIEGFRKDIGKPISTQTRFNVAVLNSLWSIVTGQRFSHDDPEIGEIIEGISRMIKLDSRMVFFMPWLKTIAPKLSGWEAYEKELPKSFNFLNKFVQKRLKEGSDPPEHFTDVYINEIRKTTDTNSSFYKERGEATLVATLLDLFVAGAETTSTTLTYIFLYLALFPEKQEKLHEEIDRVLGTQHPGLHDKPRLPYTEAVIMETMRFSSMVPRGIFHKALEDTWVFGYFIPKDTWVGANLKAVHHDHFIWGDPQNFRPERFISGDEVMKHEALLPFSFGKRACLGESLAKDELFLFTATIFQQFSVGCDPSSSKPSLEQLPGLLISGPLPHNLVLQDRKLK